MLWVDRVSGRYFLTLNTGSANYLDSTTARPTVGTWQHLAATYDGTTARFYVDGVAGREQGLHRQRRRLERLAHRRVRRDAGRLLRRAIDEIRIYDRALSAAEVTTDMNTRRPQRHDGADGAGRVRQDRPARDLTISTSWTASTDNIGVAGYRLFPTGRASGRPTGTAYTFTGLTCTTSYPLGVEAFDASGNTSARATLTADTGTCDATPADGERDRADRGRDRLRHRRRSARTRPTTTASRASSSSSTATNLGAEDTSAPYSVNWNTRRERRARTRLRGRARPVRQHDRVGAGGHGRQRPRRRRRRRRRRLRVRRARRHDRARRRPATATTARSSARRWTDRQVRHRRSTSTARASASTCPPSARSTRPASRSRRGSRSAARSRRGHRRQLDTTAARCCGSTTSRATTA